MGHVGAVSVAGDILVHVFGKTNWISSAKTVTFLKCLVCCHEKQSDIHRKALRMIYEWLVPQKMHACYDW